MKCPFSMEFACERCRLYVLPHSIKSVPYTPRSPSYIFLFSSFLTGPLCGNLLRQLTRTADHNPGGSRVWVKTIVSWATISVAGCMPQEIVVVVLVQSSVLAALVVVGEVMWPMSPLWRCASDMQWAILVGEIMLLLQPLLECQHQLGTFQVRTPRVHLGVYVKPACMNPLHSFQDIFGDCKIEIQACVLPSSAEAQIRVESHHDSRDTDRHLNYNFCIGWGLIDHAGLKAGVPKQSTLCCTLIGITAGYMYAYQCSSGKSPWSKAPWVCACFWLLSCFVSVISLGLAFPLVSCATA